MAGVPHIMFCVGQRNCDECRKEYPGNAAEHLERCDVCKGVYCRHEGVEDGCFETHECQEPGVAENGRDSYSGQ